VTRSILAEGTANQEVLLFLITHLQFPLSLQTAPQKSLVNFSHPSLRFSIPADCVIDSTGTLGTDPTNATQIPIHRPLSQDTHLIQNLAKNHIQIPLKLSLEDQGRRRQREAGQPGHPR